MNLMNTLLVAAASGAMMGAAGCGGSQMSSDMGATSASMGAKHACKGQNACKGQGGCKTDAHACKGQNACKGQGGCKTA